MNYFTSDPHLGHEKAINFPDRKEFTLDSWAEMFYDIVHSKVKKGDRLYILGDFAFGKEKDVARYRNRLKLKDVWLIRGNHCQSKKVLTNVFGDKWVDVLECKVKGAPTWLSHYPHLAWPKSHYGSFHLYGHLHDQRTDYWTSIFPEMRSLDVCPESYKRHFSEWGIFSEDQIYDILSVRKGHDDVSWYREQRGEL